MSEQYRPQFEINAKERERLERVGQIKELVQKITEQHRSLPFFGISPETRKKIQEDDEECPPEWRSTPIDEILKRCEHEGMKVVLSNTQPDSGNVFVLPAGSDDIEQDSILLHLLEEHADMDPTLQLLLDLVQKK